jgi:competence protein ComGC
VLFRSLGLSLPTLMRNQLGTPEGFTLLALIVLLFVVNVILIELVTHQKMDY